MTTRAFLVRLVPLLVLALGLRLAYSLLLAKTQPLLGDGLEFHNLAYSIADSGRYAQASFLTPDHVVPTADKPPLYPFVLALFTLIGGHGWIPHQIAGALIGTGTVAVTAFLGRRVAGDVAGLIAGGLAAVYPMLIAADGSFRSESLYALLIVATLLSAYALWDRPTWRRALVCGVLIGLATLTRSEAIVLLVLLVFPAGLLAVRPRRAAVLTLTAAAATAVVLTPWLVRCWIQFDRPVFISTNSGGLLALGAFLAGVIVCARRCMAADEILAAGPIAGFVTWAIHAGLDWLWEMPAVSLLALALAALLVARADAPTARQA